ncbi:hypothetical protein, partial [Staphylococcus epidermidis]|uniref:hypothetical protein n=1 Tax=Staphylococcus epidermidis TaxID=1282 RepID=UPI00273A26CB
LLIAFGVMRSLEFIVRGKNSMQNASEIYIKLSKYADIQAIGWFLLTSSIVLLCSVFIKGSTSYVLLIIGGICAGSVHLFYGMVATETARVIATYYTTLTLGLYQYILAGIGVISLWKIKQNKD